MKSIIKNGHDIAAPMDRIPKTNQRLIYYVLDFNKLFVVLNGVFTNKQKAINYCVHLNKTFPESIYRFNWQWNDKNGVSEISKLVEKRRQYENACNFCESCAMDLATCDCVRSRPVTVSVSKGRQL